jgi:RNA-directed DNA polymerase
MGSSFERENSDQGAGPAKPGKPPGQVKPRSGGGASVVVRARESRVHGDGRQEKRTEAKTLERAMYVATQSDKDWLQSEQGKLYKRGQEDPSYVFRKLWGLITDPRNLRIAVARVASNRGRRTAGVDGVTVRTALRDGIDTFVANARAELRSGAYRPSPVRRVCIPKAGQPGKHRALGIPTVKDRVVQAALKNILEPIFEADFYPVSYGFRPGKSTHGALEHLRMVLNPRGRAERRAPYQWAVEGDIKACFDHIDHHALMERVRRRVIDPKVNRVIVAFLKSGILSEGQFLRSEAGTPQGGILSPLLANIALSCIEERYAGHVQRRLPGRPNDPATMRLRAHDRRAYDWKCGRIVCYPLRYADDFIILVGARGPDREDRAREAAENEKIALAKYLKEQLGVELSETKTVVTPVTNVMKFLGHHVKVRLHPFRKIWNSTAVIPKERTQRLRERIKKIFRRSTIGTTLASRLRQLNSLLRGWGYFYRHAWGASRVFSRLDHYVWWTIARWLRKKHRRSAWRLLSRKYGWRKPGCRGLRWQDGNVRPFELSRLRVERYRLAWETPPAFVKLSGEPGAQRKVHAGFGRGRPETDPT